MPSAGKRLVCAIKLGNTFATYPTRVPDVHFYRELLHYTNVKSWVVPGHGDFLLRLEEFVMANDGRWDRAGAGRGGLWGSGAADAVVLTVF